MASPFIKLPPPLNDEALYNHYLKISGQISKPQSHVLYKGRCDAVCLHKGPKAWACMVAGRGILGMHNSKIEAMHHALCAALMFEDQKTGKIESVKAQMAQKKMESDSQTDTDNTDDETEGKRTGLPATGLNLTPRLSTTSIDEKSKDHAYKPRRLLGNEKAQKNGVIIAENENNSSDSCSDDGAAIIAFKNNAVSPERSGPSIVEMRDPARGTIIKRFNSTFHASLNTNILREKIEEACEDGGGLVDKYLFRYSTKAATRGENTFTKPSAVLPHKSEHQIPKKKSSLQSKHSLKVKGKQLPKVLQQKAIVPSTQKHIDFFDLCSLHPVRKKTQPPKRPKRIIELMELRTGNVLCCFRGATDACRALGLERKTVTAACEIYDRNGHVTTFKTFSLRYARVPSPCAAYVFGDHPRDYKKDNIETRSDITKRFLLQHKKDLEKTEPRDPLYVEAISNRGALPRESVHIPLSDTGDVKLEQINMSLGIKFDATTNCLFCQKVLPNVMFEPCNHCVLCKACAEVACKSFCPLCHSPIKLRKQPKLALLVRPRVFSAYSII